jgi:hypothetical protein
MSGVSELHFWNQWEDSVVMSASTQDNKQKINVFPIPIQAC